MHSRAAPPDTTSVLRDVKRFYEIDLREVIDPAKLPNLMTIAKESSVADLDKLVLLLLACSVQCEKKEIYVGRLLALEAEPQRVLMMLIAQVRDEKASG